MHRADIVLIGPLDPLLPHTIRVRLSVVVAISVMVFFVGLGAVAVHGSTVLVGVVCVSVARRSVARIRIEAGPSW